MTIMAILYFVLLGALVKILLVTEKPLLCASMFAIIYLIFGWLATVHPAALMIIFVINFGYAWLFFWLLNRFQGTGLWWIILIIGVLLRPLGGIAVG
jgi:hypothetical protein